MKIKTKLEKQLEQLKNILKDSKALTLDEITKALGWSPKYKKDNRDILDQWLEAGEIMKNKRNKYNIPENLGFIKGKFSNIKGKFGFVDTDTEGYFIPRSKFGTALDGDIVLINVTTPEGKGKKEGEIIEVLIREKNTIIGIFEKKENFGFVRPTQSFGRDIYIPRNFFNKAKNGELVVVEVTFWGTDEKKPEGKIIEQIGNPFDTNNMVKALIIREGMSEDFPDEVLAEARQIPITISQEEINKRKDLRHLPIITIDGDDAKDLDDAVYVEKLENGFYKLIVAIADVSHYIP
ncbi:MAG: RNB domain-containing ribonuclease, partial [Cetobacterium sp.]